MNYVNEQNMQEILDGIARKIGTGGGSGAGLEDWQPSNAYKENDIFVYDGQIYKSIVDFESDTTFSVIQILEEYTPVGGETIIPYEKDTEISIDDIVSYDNNTYKALYNFVCGEEFSLYALEEYVPIELTDDDIKEIVAAYNPVVEEVKGINYSTTEQRIGTWIDGKPLYQKTFVQTGGVSNSTLYFVDELQNMIYAQKINSAVFKTTYTNSYENEYFASSSDCLCVNIQAGEGIYTRFGGRTVTEMYVTLQYTKTTD